jgi:hypothetical protein
MESSKNNKPHTFVPKNNTSKKHRFYVIVIALFILGLIPGVISSVLRYDHLHIYVVPENLFSTKDKVLNYEDGWTLIYDPNVFTGPLTWSHPNGKRSDMSVHFNKVNKQQHHCIESFFIKLVQNPNNAPAQRYIEHFHGVVDSKNENVVINGRSGIKRTTISGSVNTNASATKEIDYAFSYKDKVYVFGYNRYVGYEYVTEKICDNEERVVEAMAQSFTVIEK